MPLSAKPGPDPRTGESGAVAGRERRGLSIGTKLSVATVALIACISAGVYFGLSRSMATGLLTSQGDAAAALATLFTSSVGAAVVFEDHEAIAEALEHLAKNPDVTFAAVWAGTAEGVGKQLAALARDGASQTAELVAASETRLSWSSAILAVSAPIRGADDEVVAHALIELSLATQNEKIAATERRVLYGSVGVAAAVVLLLLGVSRRMVLVPLRRLQASARQLERGEPATFEIRSDDEVGKLAAALERMALAIREREEEIRRGNRELRLVMDNVGQGFLTLNERAVPSDQYSHVVEEWFGKPRAGEDFGSYLERVDPDVGRWFRAAWEQVVDGFLPTELAVDQLPKRIERGERVWNLEYRPVLAEGDALDRLVVVITEVTLLLQKERVEREQLEVIRAVVRLTNDRAGFLEFLAEGDALVAAVEEGGTADAPTVIQRCLHTLKGTASLMEVHSVVEVCHRLEERVMTECRELHPEERSELRAAWSRFRERVRPFVGEDDEQSVIVDRRQYDALLDEVRAGSSRERLLELAEDWIAEDVGIRLQRLAQHAKRLAERLDKGRLEVEVRSSSVRMPPGACGPLWRALVHAVRNAVDHGIEAPEERRAAGKPERGRLVLSAALEEGAFVITVGDDGRGIDWEALRERARQLGLPHETQQDLQRALFHDGVSSRMEVSDISGRGFGGAALDAAVRELGGRIEVASARGKGTTFRFVVPQRAISAAFRAPGARTEARPRS